ncbi:copper resistance protein CopC [Frankia sp. R43]|uniref:copper resistance CopC family protein n=1 Tax=Frankia sp. R43 TaxID=269536 RepID=UPI0006CA4C9F|nr:copper resistance CopC family protein [Frankia sp. R43]KPM55124.1 copper resistance protein CopC [Frankia sp. R43]
MQRGSFAPASRPAPAALTALLLLVLAALLAAPRAAWAHSTVLRTEPGDGSTVNAPPDRISLVFNEPVWTDYATVVVTGSDGRTLQTGPPQVIETTLTVPLRGATPGEYHVTWRVVSADGHPITGEFSFTATAAGPAASTTATATAGPATSASASASAPVSTSVAAGAAATTPPAQPAPPKEGEDWWIIGLLIAALVALGGAYVVFRRRKRE